VGVRNLPGGGYIYNILPTDTRASPRQAGAQISI